MEKRIEAVHQKLKHDIKDLRGEFKKNLQETREELKLEIKETREELSGKIDFISSADRSGFSTRNVHP